MEQGRGEKRGGKDRAKEEKGEGGKIDKQFRQWLDHKPVGVYTWGSKRPDRGGREERKSRRGRGGLPIHYLPVYLREGGGGKRGKKKSRPQGGEEGPEKTVACLPNRRLSLDVSFLRGAKGEGKKGQEGKLSGPASPFSSHSYLLQFSSAPVQRKGGGEGRKGVAARGNEKR